MVYQDYEKAIQASLNLIEHNLTSELEIHLLAKQAGYSRFHFNVFFERL